MMDDLVTEEPADDCAGALALALGGVAMMAGVAPSLWYRGIGEGFDERRQVRGILQSVGEGVVLRFALPPGAAPAFVKLRLPAMAGRYRVDAVAVGNVPVAALAARALCVRDHQLPCGDPAAVRIASSERPPTLEVDLRGLGDGGAPEGARIDVRIVREDAAGDGIAQVAQRVDGFAESASAALRALGDEVFRAQRDLRRVELMLSSQALAGAAANAALADAMASRSDRLAAALAAMDGGIASQTERFAGALAAIDGGLAERFASTNAAVDHGLQAQAAKLAALGLELQALRQDVAATRRGIEDVFWRRWLRRARGLRG